MSQPFYDDGRYQVSQTIVATPSRFYPLANTTAGVRRDPLWMGAGLALLIGTGILVYGDLLYPGETIVSVVTALLGLLGGWQTVILRLDAPGHPRTIIVSSRGRIWKLFGAIRSARMAAAGKEDPPLIQE